eukprot:TRINITY_DN100676_c0_g1_i1.p1 TRINITY_DN100676_c0_g1~~TRINITY_DN100676_c0_g1_i1.p1  ORF type:complete len:1196 (+),score=185.70 TRINITY_DN100676_c0_g1_i1:133-3720(+)
MPRSRWSQCSSHKSCPCDVRWHTTALSRQMVVILALWWLGRFAAAEEKSIYPSSDCRQTAGTYFEPTTLRCRACMDVDSQAEALGDTDTGGQLGAVAQCACKAGLVQCESGEWCEARAKGDDGTKEEGFIGQGAFQCRACPLDAATGNLTAPTQDRERCLPCHSTATLGYSESFADCACPPDHVLVEKGEDGAYLSFKRCVRCASGAYPGPAGQVGAFYDCSTCPDMRRMTRSAETGQCECRKVDPNAEDDTSGGGYVFAGGTCVDLREFDDVTRFFALESAVKVRFRDIINGREESWDRGPFGSSVGIEVGVPEALAALSMPETTSLVATSATVKWLYVRCAVGCVRGNSTACECVSNLCALVLYDEGSTLCKFLRNQIQTGAAATMPNLFYEKRADQVMQDTSLKWRFSLAGSGYGAGYTNQLTLWLATYALEGQWLGWQPVDTQLELCMVLGGGNSMPHAATSSWRRFGSSLVSKCQLPLSRLLKCGQNPVFYELFIQNVDGSLVSVPVRILNLVQGGSRPNLNMDEDEMKDDVLVRRFLLCDAVSGKEGEGAYLRKGTAPIAFRWAAHMMLQVRIRPDTQAQVYVPLLSIAYAEEKSDGLTSAARTAVSFKSEYNMKAETYWTAVTVLFALTCVLALGLALFRVYLVDRRCPLVPMIRNGIAPRLFPHKIVLQTAAFLPTLFTVFFWFQFLMSLYWLFFFKLQDDPHLLLPSAVDAAQYEPGDILLCILVGLGVISVALGLFKQLRIFIFLVDWERGTPGSDGERQRAASLAVGETLGQMNAPAYNAPPIWGGAPGQPQPPAPAMVGNAEGGAGPHKPLLAIGGPTTPPDIGVSAWRTIFVCNELNERLTSTRTTSYITWLGIAALLEGLNGKNLARWHPAAIGDEGIFAAQYNPFLQFAVAVCVWLLVVILQLIGRFLLSLRLGHDLKDFVDVCSLANVSVFFMDEPFHGYYIHGKAPSSRGDWCHSELLKVIHDEGMEIGFHRGIIEHGAQTFEFFLPQELEVPMPGGGLINFRHTLHTIFAAVQGLEAMIKQRNPPTETYADVTERSKLRCSLQALIDAMVHTVMRTTKDVIYSRTAAERFWNLPPTGGVPALTLPVFYEDPDELSWSSCLAYGGGVRPLGLEVPTGFEWHLILLELLVFILVWRFHGSIYFSVAMAFVLNQAVLSLYRYLARRMLAHTAIIDSKFLL